MNTLPIEIIQDIANRLSVEQYRAFRTVNRRCSLIDVTPYLEFTRYKQLSEECEYTYKKCIEIGRTVSPPFKLQMSELTVSQFQFLTLNGHQAEFFRSLTCSPRSILSREVKKKALVYLLTTEVPCEHMILIFMVTDPICHNIVHHRNIRHGKLIGRGIHWAAIRGYDTLMGLILETKYDVTVSGSGGMNALHFASAYGRDKVVERLLKDGRILPDVKTTTGYSSSYFAIKNEHPGCLKSLLIDPRSDLSIVICPDGYRAIDFACIGGHSKSLEVILGLNCWRIDPNMTAPGRQATPFRLAVESNRLEIVRMLLSDKRVNSKLLDARGFTVFHYAITHGSNEMVTCLLDHPAVDPNYCATDGRHAFQLPIPLEITRLLLDHYRIDPNMMDDSGYTIFHRAIMSRKPELVKLLISHARVNCSIRTRNGRHGLDLAAKDPTMLRLLLDSETTTDPNDLDNNGFTALHRAINKGGVNRVEMLLSFDGVNPNKLAHDGRHALFMATNAAVLKLLLDDEKITTPNMIDSVGYTVLHRAAMSNDIKRLEMLLSHKRVDPNLNARDGRHALGLLTNAEPLKLLLDCGKIDPPYMVDINVRSIFHRAVISNDMTLLKLLLSHKKVDPNLLVRDGIQSLGIYIKPETLGLSEDNGSIELEYDNNGYNLFHRAVINDEKALIIMLLLCPRYQLNVLAFSGKHALDLASSPETVTLLLSSAQIEVNLMDDNGLTFFHRTIINSKNQVLEVLLSHERINPNLLTGTKTHALDLATTPETLSLLLNNSRIDVNVMDDRGLTFFHRTLMNGKSNALKVLLSHERINPNIETGTRKQALSLANSSETLQILLDDERIDPNVLDHFGLAAVHRAAMRDKCNLLLTLLAHDRVYPNILARDGPTLLNLSAKSKALNLLLDNPKIAVNMLDGNGHSIFHKAIIDDEYGLLEILLSHKRIDPNCLTGNGDHALALSSNPEVIGLLLRCKKVRDPSVMDGKGLTAFHHAVISGKSDVVKFLLSQRRVDPNALTGKGKHSLFLASETGTLKLLLDCKKISTPNMVDQTGHSAFHRAVMRNEDHMLKMLLAHERIEPNLPTSDGVHALALATSAKTLKLLLDCERINPDMLITNESTAFHRATRNDRSNLPLYLRMSAEGSETRKAATRAMKKLAKKYDLRTLLYKMSKAKTESGVNGVGATDLMDH